MPIPTGLDTGVGTEREGRPAASAEEVTPSAASGPCPAAFAYPAGDPCLAPVPRASLCFPPRPSTTGGAIASGRAGNTGFSRDVICDDENVYACDSLRICAAASSLFLFPDSISVCADSLATSEASGSFRAARAASRFARAPASVRGIDACADAIAFDASPSHLDTPSL
jgi:hypothetical protein